MRCEWARERGDSYLALAELARYDLTKAGSSLLDKVKNAASSEPDADVRRQAMNYITKEVEPRRISQ